MDTTNNKVTINETIIVDDKVIDFIALANMAHLKPDRIAGYLNSFDFGCNATDKDYHWTEDKIKTVLETVTVERELRVLGLTPDDASVPWHGFRMSGPMAPITPEEEADIEASIVAMVTGGLSRIEVEEQIEEAHSEKWGAFLKVLNHHSATFGQEKMGAYLKYLKAEVRTHSAESAPNPFAKAPVDAE